MHRFDELSDVQSTLQRLMQRPPPLVKVLPRQPGTKGLAQLEAEIAALREEVVELCGQVQKVLRLVE
jgi:uncharacterized protein YceH (UPF0502 family)